MNQRIILAGGSGFLGQSLAKELMEKDYDVVILSRSSPKDASAIKYQEWDGKTLGDWIKHLEGAVAVVNLTGKSVIELCKSNRNYFISTAIQKHEHKTTEASWIFSNYEQNDQGTF